MIIYCVQYPTGYEYNEIIGYFLSKEDAEEYAKQAEKDNPGYGYFVEDLEAL